MMKPVHLTAALAAAALLSACGQNAETNTTAASETAVSNASEDMDNIAMPAEPRMAKSTGTVTAIDKGAGKITVAHAPIPEVNWPEMTMAFNAKPEVIDKVAVGDKVAFDVTITGMTGEVTAIAKQ